MKKKVRGIYILLCFCVFTPLVLQAQTDEEKRILQEREEISKQKKGGSVVVDERTALELFDNTPSFGIFRDNYFVTGVPTNRKIDKKTQCGCQVSDQYPATSDEKYFAFQDLLVFNLHAAFVLGHLREVQSISG